MPDTSAPAPKRYRFREYHATRRRGPPDPAHL